MASEIQIQVTNEANTPIVTVQDLREQIVLSVRKHGDDGPQTGDVELEPDMLKDFRQNKNAPAVINRFRRNKTFSKFFIGSV